MIITQFENFEKCTKLKIREGREGILIQALLLEYILLCDFSVSLVEQQAAHIEHHTALNVGKMHGHLNQDIWSEPSKFDTFIALHEVSPEGLVRELLGI